MSPAGDPRPSEPPRRAGRSRLRLLRVWAWRVAGVAAGLAVLAVLAALWVMASLERPWLKRRILAAAQSAGIELDYRSARIAVLSGLEIDGLVVRTPAEMRRFAPDLVRVERIEATWSMRSLLGHGPRVERLRVSGVALAVVVDEDGRTSFDALSPPDTSPPPPSPSTPLSHQAATYLGAAPPVGVVLVDGVSATVIRTVRGEVSERSSLGGLALGVTASPAASEPGWRVTGGLGAPTSPLHLAVSREHDGQAASARGDFWLTIDATSSTLTTALDLRVPEQTFAPSVAASHWLHAEADLRFDPRAGRTVVTIARTDAGDGAATAEAKVEVPDEGAPVVDHARGEADLGRMLQWLPAGLVPVTAERATVRYQVDSLVAGATPRFAASPDAGASLDVELAGLGLEGDSPLRLSSMKGTARARAGDAGALVGQASLHLGGIDVGLAGGPIDIDDLELDLEGKLAPSGDIDGRLEARFKRFEQKGSAPLVASGGRIELRADGVHPGASGPLSTRAGVRITADVASIDARSGRSRVHVEGLGLEAQTRLDGHAPYALELRLPLKRLRLADGDATRVDAPAHLQLSLRDATPDLARPAESRAVVHATLDLGTAKVSLDATKAPSALDFALHLDVPTLGIARPFLDPSLARAAPWDQMALRVQSSGHVDHLTGGAPALQETTEIDVDRPAFENVSAHAAVLTLRSKGDASAHELSADLRAQGLVAAGAPPSDDHVTLSASLDRAKRSFKVDLATEGRAATKVTAAGSFDSERRAVLFDVDAHLAGLGPLAPLVARVRGLEGLELPQLDVTFGAHGALLGAIAAISPGGDVQLEPHPSRTAGVEGKIDLRVEHLHYAHGDTAVITPGARWHGELRVAGERRTVDSHLEAGAVHLDLGPNDVDLTAIRDDSTVVVSGDLRDPESGATQRTTIQGVKQDFVPAYPVGDLAFSLKAERDREGLVHVGEMKVVNGAGGTTLDLSGNVELEAGRRRLSVTTTLGQDLARLSLLPDRFSGVGKLTAEATVASPDLSLFRVRASLKGEGVSLKMPRAGVEVQGANGEVPITVSVEVTRDGVGLEEEEKRSPYSMLRFADQHPLLTRSGFLSIASVKTPMVSIAPLVGNLEIEQNVVSLRQFEMGIRGGSVTGQCGIDWDGPRSSIELHVRATGVQSSHGEPFDGNIAVVISAADRTVEGRAEILRIGERHLLDLLDMQDPRHVDPAMNRIRAALTVGYPDRLRLVFDHGFASARLELGGLARLVSIGELRGIPMGPIMDKFLAPLLDPHDTEESP